MKETWQIVAAKLKEIAPLVYEDLNEGATQAEIDELQSLMGVKLPADLIEFYKIHNGQTPIKFDPDIAFFNHHKLMSVAEITEVRTMWTDMVEAGEFVDRKGLPKRSKPDAGIKDGWWNTLWLPFFDDANSNHYCIDLDPSPEGNYGQVIQTWHDDHERRLIAPSLKAWFIQYKEDLATGKLVVKTHGDKDALTFCGIEPAD